MTRNPDPAAVPVPRRGAPAASPSGCAGEPGPAAAPIGAGPGTITSRQPDSPTPPADGRPGPETTRPGRASVRAGDQNPAGVLTPREGGTPAGSTRLRGAEALEAIRRAQSKARRAPAVRKPAARTAAPPVPASGASLTAAATCLAGCGWTAGPGDPAEVDKAAKAHTEKPPKHPTNLFSEPAAGAA